MPQGVYTVVKIDYVGKGGISVLKVCVLCCVIFVCNTPFLYALYWVFTSGRPMADPWQSFMMIRISCVNVLSRSHE